MYLFLKIALIIALFSLSYQDLRERKVYLSLLIIIGIIMAFFHFKNSDKAAFLGSVSLNITIILTIYLILTFYSNWKLKKSIIQTFGFGDVIFFGIIAIGFSTVSFLILFSFSLIFSLLAFIILKPRFSNKTVPLAGLQSIFIALIFVFNWLFKFTNLYTI